MSPNMNGVDATRAIRTLAGYVETPILTMTAKAFDEDRQVCLEAGMNDHIAKSVDTEKLFEILLKWLERRGDRWTELRHKKPRTKLIEMRRHEWLAIDSKPAARLPPNFCYYCLSRQIEAHF